jgi:hypothetical protein
MTFSTPMRTACTRSTFTSGSTAVLAKYSLYSEARRLLNTKRGTAEAYQIQMPCESVLFIGTQFNNRYTAVNSPAEAA